MKNQEPFRHHPEVLQFRALITEGLFFHALSQRSFDEIMTAIDKVYVDRDSLVRFLQKRELVGDFEREIQFGDLD
ncbi:hypothetical protein [Leptospira adleri]|uniref:Uncharacterized protein n=1 Tax=Leptospira adleri TaxID=2023186 RepID=A0A2M9YJ23_9LEPT|nr:hypothetical protein [Leptospira adleri]PJZ51510.1 hypothetical protein CH380_19685 [Leptospira adleri]PJZ61582.1 hypothetical protein CH376_12400 [Leptospira adleri]